MERRKVQSTAIAAVGYDVATRILEVEFPSGGVYQYLRVPSAVYAEFVCSEHPGLYFQNKFRGHYECVPVITTAQAKAIKEAPHAAQTEKKVRPPEVGKARKKKIPSI